MIGRAQWEIVEIVGELTQLRTLSGADWTDKTFFVLLQIIDSLNINLSTSYTLLSFASLRNIFLKVRFWN